MLLGGAQIWRPHSEPYKFLLHGFRHSTVLILVFDGVTVKTTNSPIKFTPSDSQVHDMIPNNNEQRRFPWKNTTQAHITIARAPENSVLNKNIQLKQQGNNLTYKRARYPNVIK